MMKDSQVWEDCFSTPFGKLANVFASIRNGGLALKDRFAAVALRRFRIGCYTENFPIASRLFPFFTSAAIRSAGGIA